jgi:hypothetical protein
MRRSSRLAAVARRIGPDAATFASLPLPVARLVFLALPVDARGRACCVCRAWRDTLAEPSLWTRLDMSFLPELAPFDIVGPRRARFLVLLHGAAGRARGVQQLKFSKQYLMMHELQPVLTANAGSLRELHLCEVDADDTNPHNPTVQAVVAAAPLLQVLTSESVSCKWQNAVRILHSEPQFALLQCRTLTVEFYDHSGGGMGSVGPVAAALADAALQPALLRLRIQSADTAQPAVMGALVDAVLARRLPELSFRGCTRPAAAPLARLLAEGSLASFEICFLRDDAGTRGTPLFDAAGAALVAGALRLNTTLTSLELFRADLCVDVRVSGALLGALIGHSSLRELKIVAEHSADGRTFGAALAALIAADAPALHVLRCRDCSLGDAGLAPIVEALALNHYLRTLDVGGSGMSEVFARERLLPAVRANTTLRELKCTHDLLRPTAAQAEAEELVRRRWQPD